MSTAYYYVEKPPCPHCGHAAGETFIGKSSGGWQFAFITQPYERSSDFVIDRRFKSWSEWRAFLATVHQLRNEYGDVVTLDEFAALVNAKQGDRVSSIDYLDADGYSMHDGWFS